MGWAHFGDGKASRHVFARRGMASPPSRRRGALNPRKLVQWPHSRNPESAMPLLDHFHPSLSRTHPWRGFDGGWAAAMARLLNAGVLPAGYYAVPFLDRDGPVEIDVAALHESEVAGPVVGSTEVRP